MKPATLPPQPSRIARIAWFVVPLAAAAMLAVGVNAQSEVGATPRVEGRCEAPTEVAAPASIEGVNQLDARRYAIERSVLERWIATGAFLRGVRVIPSSRHGRYNGLKLYAIRPGSIAAAAGFRNGDTLVAVNGRALDGPETTWEAFTTLAGRRDVVIDVVRRGEPLALHYAIVP